MARISSHVGKARHRPDTIRLPFFFKWERAIGIPQWRVMAATDLAATTLVKAENGMPIARATARLLAMALELPFEMLVSVDPDQPEARELIRLRSISVEQELASYRARLDARRLAVMRAIPALVFDDPSPEREQVAA